MNELEKAAFDAAVFGWPAQPVVWAVSEDATAIPSDGDDPFDGMVIADWIRDEVLEGRCE